MKPNRDITDELREIFKQATPRKPASDPEPPGPSGREIKIRLQIAVYAAIASLSLAVFFWGSLRLMAHSGVPRVKPAETIVEEPPAETGPAFMRVSYTDQQIRPVGKITSPVTDTATDRTVTVTGYTVNIPVDTPFVWVMVDVPAIGRTWPKKPVIQPNGSFRVSFYEGGPGAEYTVSLYAVGYGLNRLIEHWVDEGNFGGLPMIPQQYRLDSVRLVLGGV